MPEIWFPNLGIEIAHLDRVAFTVFGRNVYWYGIFIGLAVVLGVLMAMKEAKRTGQSPDMYVDFIIYALIFAIIGARLYYVIFSWDFYSAHPEKIFALREGGLAIYGGIIGALLVGIGNYMPRIGQNYTMGVKTPWALNDPENWRRTQRFGGKCFVLMGIAVAAFGFAGPYLTDAVAAAAISVVCLGGCIAMYAYSYLLFVGKIR